MPFFLYSCSLAKNLCLFSPKLMEFTHDRVQEHHFPHLLWHLLQIYGSSCCHHEPIPGNAQTHSPKVKCIFCISATFVNSVFKEMLNFTVRTNILTKFSALFIWCNGYTPYFEWRFFKPFILCCKCTYENTGYIFCSLTCVRGIKG